MKQAMKYDENKYGRMNGYNEFQWSYDTAYSEIKDSLSNCEYDFIHAKYYDAIAFLAEHGLYVRFIFRDCSRKGMEHFDIHAIDDFTNLVDSVFSKEIQERYNIDTLFNFAMSYLSEVKGKHIRIEFPSA